MNAASSMSALHQLAEDLGIVPEYYDQTVREKRITSDETRCDLLATMGIDTSSEESIVAELARIRAMERRRLVAPVRVLEVADPAARSIAIQSPLTQGTPRAWR